MKNVLFGICLVFVLPILAQKPEPVYSIVKGWHEASWYETQLNLWKLELDKTPQNGDAWMNYYASARALRATYGSEPTKKQHYHDLCKKIVADCVKAIPNTFESYLLNHVENAGFGGDASELLKAAALRPYDLQILDEMLIYYATERNREKFTLYGEKMFETNELSAPLLNWGYNILAELDQDAILFTGGDNDTYAPWIIQAAKKFRTDVTVINTSLITVDTYRNKLLKELGYEPLNITFSKITSQAEFQTAQQTVFSHFLKGKRPAYISASVQSQFDEAFGKNLYLTGLALKYSETSFDNSSVIRRNYEKRYLLDYLTELFSNNISNSVGESFNAMYLPSLIKLYQHYSESEEVVKKQEIEKIMLRVAEQTGQQSEIIDLLSTNEQTPSFLSTLLDIKALEKNLVPLTEKLFFSKTELTNGEYTLFLKNLKKSGQTDIYQIALYDSTQWAKGELSQNFNDPMVNMYHSHTAYENYPVLNISYEGAKAYCEWLTKQYNLQRKRTYTQVLFRLPTELEWRTAAGSGNPKAITPFPNDQIKTSKDCYLGNIRPFVDRFYEDGGFHTVKTSSYDANPLGLYCTLGNVAEMTTTKGKAMGGSWFHLFEECTFDTFVLYTGPTPTVGFRVVMEIIEK